MLNADNEFRLIVIAEEKQHRTILGAKRAPVAIMLAVFAVAPKAHDTFFQIALVLADATMATFVVVHSFGLSPPAGIEC